MGEDSKAYIFCGQICSGKSQILKKVCELTGAERFSTGQVIEEDLIRLGRPTDRYSMQAHGDTDPKRWAYELINRAQGSGNGNVFGFECMRYPEQIQIMLDAFPNSLVVGVKAPLGMRLDWILKRGREGDPTTIEGLREVDRRDWLGYETGIGQNTRGCFQMIEDLVRKGRGLILDNDIEGKNNLERYAKEVAGFFVRV